MDRQAQLQVRDRYRERAVGGPRVGAVLAEQLELGDVAGGEVPRPGVQLEHLGSAGGDAVEPAGHERLGVGGRVDVPQPRREHRERPAGGQGRDHRRRAEQGVARSGGRRRR